MRPFKEQVQKDIPHVFLQEDFFGETHLLNGTPVTMVDDNEFLASQQVQGRLGMGQATGTIFIAARDVPKGIGRGSTIDIDGRGYLVDDIRTDMGVVTLSVHQNRGR